MRKTIAFNMLLLLAFYVLVMMIAFMRFNS